MRRSRSCITVSSVCVLSKAAWRLGASAAIPWNPSKSKKSLDPDVTLGLSMSMSEMLKAQQFASLGGVTVRTLHHYDRLGLLKPGGRTESGYRLYRKSDLAVL